MENRKIRWLRRLRISRKVVCPENPAAVVDVPNWRNPLTWIYVSVAAPVALFVILWRQYRA